MFSLLFALAQPALAASHEISFELGWITTEDPAWGYFSSSGAIGSYGIRGGFEVHPNVTIIGGWQHSQTGASVEISSWGDDDYDDEDEYYDGAFQTAMYSDQITLGSKADVKLFKWLHPYVTAQLAGMRGLVRMDDDSGDDENLTQVEKAGVTGGVIGAAGLDFLIRVKGDVYIAPYFELGYGWYAPMVIEDLGSVQFSGFAGRAGVGVRF